MTGTGAGQTVFLDRDGVINRDSPDYITRWDQFVFIPGSLAAIARLTAAGAAVIVITNQSAVGRGMMDGAALENIHRNLCRTVAARGGRIDAVFHCPHHPDRKCDCRKPEPGLILQAQRRFNLDLAAATMIGDSARDVQCGLRAGCGRTILVRSGLHDDLPRLEALNMRPTRVADDLAAAVDWLLAQRPAASR
jgi:D-glycero-D-manno-heptose 1,7-bisphosphate phosphatase